MAPAMKWMAKKTAESEEKPAKGKGGGKAKKESNKGSSGKDKGNSSSSWWNDWEYDSWGWNDWGAKPKSKKGKGEEEKGSKGKSKGKYEEEEKKGKGKGGKGKEKGDWPPNGAKTVAEVEAEMNQGKIERVKRNPDSVGKQPVEATGAHCQVHKHSGMGCAVVSLANHETKEAIMNYSEKTYGRSAAGKLEMDIADVKVQLKRHKDKGSGREVLTDIFVAWGHQQEKDSPLTVDEIAEFFDKLYEDTMNAPPGATAPPVAPAAVGGAAAVMAQARGLRPPPPPAMHMPHPPQPNPYYSAMYANMMNPAMGAMNPYMQQQFAAQQAQAAAYAAYHQQMAQQQQYMHMYDAKGKWGGKGMKGAGKGKDKGPSQDAAAVAASVDASAAAAVPAVPAVPVAEGEAAKAEASAEGGEPSAVPGVPDFSPPKPRLLQIVDPASGKPIDTIGMNFAPRKASMPLAIKNPTTGEAVDMEGPKS